MKIICFDRISQKTKQEGLTCRKCKQATNIINLAIYLSIYRVTYYLVVYESNLLEFILKVITKKM